MDYEYIVLELFKMAQSKKTVLNNKPEQLANAFMEFRKIALEVLRGNQKMNVHQR